MIIGVSLFVIGFNMFLSPAKIAPGGLTGISLILNHLFPSVSVGLLILIMNIPLFILGLKKLGGSFVRNTIFTTVFLSIMLDVFHFLPALTTDPLLAAIYGGVFLGAGMGITFLPNSSTGGTDIAIRVLRLKHPQLSMGQIMLLIDVVVISSAAIVFKNINNALYAIITMYVASLVIDTILYGLNYAKVAFIITDQANDVNESIMNKLVRGTTLIDCAGGYHATPRKIIMCAIKRNQITALKEAVYSADENAFVILSEAREVLGYGFQKHSKNTL